MAVRGSVSVRAGRPSIPADVVASVLVLQTLEDRSDSEAMTALRCDMRWKVACGLPLTTRGSIRRRWCMAASTPIGSSAADLGGGRAVIAATGVLKGKRRRTLDSVVLDDAVATQDTVTQLIAAVRRVGREVRGAGERIATECSAHD